MRLQKLYRPVGLFELQLIQQSDFQAFPARLDWQPYFYPVLNQQYAEEIASKWNVNDAASGYAGFVTSFALPQSYLRQFEIQNVGGQQHNELWIPAEELTNFNQQIQDRILIINAFYGKLYEGPKIQLDRV